MDDYIIFVIRTERYQILKSFASEKEAIDYAWSVEVDDDDLSETDEDRWAELSGA